MMADDIERDISGSAASCFVVENEPGMLSSTAQFLLLSSDGLFLPFGWTVSASNQMCWQIAATLLPRVTRVFVDPFIVGS